MSSGMALGGLVSGMDTESIIQKLMQVESMKVNLQAQRKAQIAAKQKAWSDVESSLSTLKSKLDTIRFPSIFQARSATLTDANVAAVLASSGAALVTHSLEVKGLAQTHSLGSAYQSTANTELNLSGTLTISGKTISVGTGDTLNSLRDQINATADVGVTASVVKVMQGTSESYRLVLTAKTGGLAGKIDVQGSGTLAQDLGFGMDVNGKYGNELSAAADANFVLNGVEYFTGSNTVADVLPGVTLTLKTKGTTTITVGQDTDKLADAVQAWVDQMNSTMSKLNDLTAAGGKDKTAGVLNGDTLARRIQMALRQSLSTVQSDLPKTMNQLSQAGVKTGAWGTADYGRVLLDKEKLKEQLLADPDAVARLFGAMRANVAVGAAIATPNSTANQSSLADLTNGDTDPARFGHLGGGWESEASPVLPNYVEVHFRSEDPTQTNVLRQIDQVELYTPEPTATAGISAFTLEYLADTNGTWKELASVASYSGTYELLECSAVSAYAVRLKVTATNGNGPIQLSELKVNAANQGPASGLYGFLKDTLADSTGSLATKDQGMSDQIRGIDKQIARMNDQMEAHEQRLRQQFARMEAALAQMQAQGSAFMAQAGSLNAGGQK